MLFFIIIIISMTEQTHFPINSPSESLSFSFLSMHSPSLSLLHATRRRHPSPRSPLSVEAASSLSQTTTITLPQTPKADFSASNFPLHALSLHLIFITGFPSSCFRFVCSLSPVGILRLLFFNFCVLLVIYVVFFLPFFEVI